MSLKAFHVFFVAVSTLLVLGLGAWSLVHGFTGLGVGSFVAAAVLVWYGLWFLRKLKNVSYL